MRVVALVPAHNEQASIEAALRSLAAQTRRLDRVIVIADNCTDATAQVARMTGADAFETVDNAAKKAGALNQALERLLPDLADDDRVLVMDADTTLGPSFVDAALTAMADPAVGAVGGVFFGQSGGGLVGFLQRCEYVRYARSIEHKGGRAMVLTGTATLHRVDVLRRLTADRGRVYDTLALTEDNEVTLAIKSLGYRTVSPAACWVMTEIMPAWRDLWRQRLRWQRGALENLRSYGLTRVTAPYVFQQATMAFGLVAMCLYLVWTCWWVTSAQSVDLWTPYLLLGGAFIAERVVTVWRKGWRARLVASVLVIEWAYDLVLQAVLVKAISDIVLRRNAAWHHVAARPATSG